LTSKEILFDALEGEQLDQLIENIGHGAVGLSTRPWNLVSFVTNTEHKFWASGAEAC
jgi:hypothetical protein